MFVLKRFILALFLLFTCWGGANAQSQDTLNSQLYLSIPLETSGLNQQTQSTIDSFLQVFSPESIGRLWVEGYAEEAEDSSQQLRMGEDRARAVLRHLYYRGVPIEAMTYQGSPKAMDWKGDSSKKQRNARVFVLRKGDVESGLRPRWVCQGLRIPEPDTIRYQLDANNSVVIHLGKVSIIEGPDGEVIEVPASEIATEIRLVLKSWTNPREMLAKGMPTATSTEALVTAGVYQLSAFKGGEALPELPKGTVLKIPVRGPYAELMEPWQLGRSGNMPVWETDQEVKISVNDQEGFWEMEGMVGGSFCNMDLRLSSVCAPEDDLLSLAPVDVWVKVKGLGRRSLRKQRLSCFLKEYKTALFAGQKKGRWFKTQVPLCPGLTAQIEGNLMGRKYSKFAKMEVKIPPKGESARFKLRLRRQK